MPVSKVLEDIYNGVCEAVKKEITVEKPTFPYVIEVRYTRMEYAEKVYEKHCLIRSFLQSLGVNVAQAEEDACRMEHLLSDETFEIMKKPSEIPTAYFLYVLHFTAEILLLDGCTFVIFLLTASQSNEQFCISVIGDI